MLSYLYRMIQGFKRQHGREPNRVYMSEGHYQQLLDSLPGMRNDGEVARFLAMEIIISAELRHPDVALVSLASPSSLRA
jgi:hypothetical protein